MALVIKVEHGVTGVTRFLTQFHAELLNAEKRAVRAGAILVAQRALQRVNRIGGTPPAFRGKHAAKRLASYRSRLAAGGANWDFLFVRSGNLRASLTKAGQVQTKSDLQGVYATVGFRKGAAEKYSPVHEFGTPRAGRSHKVVIPARAPLHKSKDERKPKYLELIRAEIARVVRNIQVRS